VSNAACECAVVRESVLIIAEIWVCVGVSLVCVCFCLANGAVYKSDCLTLTLALTLTSPLTLLIPNPPMLRPDARSLAACNYGRAGCKERVSSLC
jgi:hypothetical protein